MNEIDGSQRNRFKRNYNKKMGAEENSNRINTTQIDVLHIYVC